MTIKKILSNWFHPNKSQCSSSIQIELELSIFNFVNKQKIWVISSHYMTMFFWREKLLFFKRFNYFITAIFDYFLEIFPICIKNKETLTKIKCSLHNYSVFFRAIKLFSFLSKEKICLSLTAISAFSAIISSSLMMYQTIMFASA